VRCGVFGAEEPFRVSLDFDVVVPCEIFRVGITSGLQLHVVEKTRFGTPVVHDDYDCDEIGFEAASACLDAIAVTQSCDDQVG
jgi:hypothetical protein